MTAEVGSGSTVPRRQLGRYLRKLREEAKIGAEAAGKRLEWSKAKMYRIEAGKVPLRTLDVRAMCGMYGAPADLTEALVALAGETKSKGWWQSYGEAVPDWFELYVSMEAAASQLRHYEPGLVPGLLQTGEYAAAIIGSARGISESDIEQAVGLRLERQKLLAREVPAAPRLDVILDEAVLRRPIADRLGMRGQLKHLARMSESPNVTVRVLPLAAGPHQASITGAFVVLNFPADGPREPEPTTVYSESLTGALYLDKTTEIDVYEEVWDSLNAMALSPAETVNVLTKIAEDELHA